MTHFVRENAVQPLPPPNRDARPVRWIRENLLGSRLNMALTVFGLALVYLLMGPLIRFAFIDAVWTGSSGADCQGQAGACWPFVMAKIDQFIFGRYPQAERWRIAVAGALTAAGIAALLWPRMPRRGLALLYVLLILPLLAGWLLHGGMLGLAEVETSLWGGLTLTLVIALTGIAASLPLGVLLALGRRSELPLIRWLSIGFIELWRGVPLVTVLFMASVLLPLFLPGGVSLDKLLRALVAVALFASAYMAEVVRGGLQSIRPGQYEAARALGLGYWQMMTLVILPQALKNVIPGIVNTFIGLFKDTTLVLIIGLFDFLGMIQLGLTDAKWSAPYVSHTGYLFAATVFWAFCFSLSRYSAHLERRLSVGGRR